MPEPTDFIKRPAGMRHHPSKGPGRLMLQELSMDFIATGSSWPPKEAPAVSDERAEEEGGKRTRPDAS